jgi:glycosyltransferase involved in cell wall biosynthesis
MASGKEEAISVLVLLGVSRLVAKKGLDVLLDALARLPADLHWRYEHVGGGEQKAALAKQASSLGLEGRIVWRGAAPQDEVIDSYRRAELFVLASRIADDGDRDGLPNVLMEAGSQELAAISSAVSAVPELIQDGETGLLVAPDDAAALAAALESLIRDPERRLALGRAARAAVLERFAMEPGLDRLAARLRTELGETRSAAA